METFEEYMLVEMPITDFKKIGKWNDPKNRHGYDKASVGILNSDRGVQKLKDTFSKVPYNFNLYFVKQPNAWQHAEIGEVSPEKLKQYLGIELGKDVPFPSDDDITVFFTNNRATDRTPLTPWTIAHRIGHSMHRSTTTKRFKDFRRYFGEIENILKDIMRDVYRRQEDPNSWDSPFSNFYNYKNDSIRNFLESIGTFRSARMKKLNRPHEFIHEAFAQYLLTGRVKLNDFPNAVALSNRKAWGNDTGGSYRNQDPVAANEYKMNLQNALENFFDYMIGTHHNTVSIM